MDKNFIKVPNSIKFQDIINSKNTTLSATQYKTFDIKNKNQKRIEELLIHKLERKEQGIEVGSNLYMDKSPYIFLKTGCLQDYTYLPVIEGSNFEYMAGTYDNKEYVKELNLKKGDIIVSKDSNVGEICILDKDYPNALMSSGMHKLPLQEKYKYYTLAFIKSAIVRQQIDFLVPRGSTIRHGKDAIFYCNIPFPNKDEDEIIKYIDCLMKSIINKEILIREKFQQEMEFIDKELKDNQLSNSFVYKMPTFNEISSFSRMDGSIYSKHLKKFNFLITNYKNGCRNIYELNFDISRGQNLQISQIGKSIETSDYHDGFYKVIKPKVISTYGLIMKNEFLGNQNKLKTLQYGDLIFGAEGNEKGRSYVYLLNDDDTITNIHGITLNSKDKDIEKSIFVKIFLDYLRFNGIIDKYAVGGNGGSLAIKYWDNIYFPNFPIDKEKELVKFYYTNNDFKPTCSTIEEFETYDKTFENNAGIYDLDKAKNYLQNLLNNAMLKIVNDEKIDIKF